MKPPQRAASGRATPAALDRDQIVINGVDYLLSGMEMSWNDGSAAAARPSGLAATEELEKIQQQLSTVRPALLDQNGRAQLDRISSRVEGLRVKINTELDAWRRTELARHPQRPYPLDYIQRLFSDWVEIHGDRRYSDDHAMICGMASFHGQQVMIIATQKARDTKQKVFRNFGMPGPEGYRKAMRAMKLAEKFSRPIFTFVDTPGAYPGLGAEERGQAEAIAHNLREMARLRVPTITTVTGEGGSGGALAIAVSDRVFMMENSIYSVISPEGCASIMWRDSAKRDIAAKAMRITAPDLSGMGIIDAIVPEPEGGAHSDHDAAAALLNDVLNKHLTELQALSPEQLIEQRYGKFRNMAQFFRVEGQQ